jgi:hypothetical protein
MENLETMNYRDLQKLAKTVGVRANLPKAELLRVLQDHQNNVTPAGNSEMSSGNADNSGAVSTEDRESNNEGTGKADSDNAGGLLNTTFEVDPDDENGAAATAALDISDDINENDSRLTDDSTGKEEDGEKEKLNGTFEIISDDAKESSTGTKTKSVRLSVSGMTRAALAKEAANSPAVRPSAAAARHIKVPSRRSVAKTPKAAAKSTVSAVVQRLTTPSAAKRKQPEESVSNIPRFVKFSK